MMEPDCGEGIFSLDYLCREYPTGESDYRVPSLLVEFEDGSRETDFLYEKAEVLEGRKRSQVCPVFIRFLRMRHRHFTLR